MGVTCSVFREGMGSNPHLFPDFSYIKIKKKFYGRVRTDVREIIQTLSECVVSEMHKKAEKGYHVKSVSGKGRTNMFNTG